MTIGPADRIDGLAYAGAYFPTAANRGSRWSALLRAAKDPFRSEDGLSSLEIVRNRGVNDLLNRNRFLLQLDVVVSVPPRMGRFRGRKISLPDELCRAMHDTLGIRYDPDALLSVVDDIELKRVPIQSRREVIRGSFAASSRKLAGKSVLLVDDIVTTGATVAECACLLRDVGVKSIFVYALGRTVNVLPRSAGLSDQPQIHKVGLGDPPCQFSRRT